MGGGKSQTQLYLDCPKAKWKGGKKTEIIVTIIFIV